MLSKFRWSHFGIIATAIVTATFIRWALNGSLGSNFPYSVYFLSVIVVAWGCGWKSAIVTLCFSCVFGTLLYIDPKHLGKNEFWGLFFFSFNSLIAIALTEYLRSSQKRAQMVGLDLIEQKHEVDYLLRQTQALAKVGEIALSSKDQQTLFNESVIHVAKAVHAQFASILQIMPNEDRMILVAGVGWDKNMIGNTKIVISDHFPSGYTLHSKEPVVVEDFEKEKRFKPSVLMKEKGIRSGVTVRIGGKSSPWGLLSVYCPRVRSFTLQEVELIRAFANILASQIERNQLAQEVEGQLFRQYEAIAELAAADRRKDEFMAMLAHELRNPLAPIMNCTSILSMDVDQETVRWALSTMERQVQHMVRLVDDLLDVSRSLRGRIDLKKDIHDLQSILFRAIETSKPVIESQRHRFTFHQPQQTVYLEVDEVRMAQVISNILNNAAKYTPENGTIELSATILNDSVQISVTDNGCGIERNLLPHIFEPFVQAERSLDRADGGLGIGLALVKSLVEMHNGSVSVQSTIGQGSRFSVLLPISEQKPLPESGLFDFFEGDHTSHRILIVDDNADAAQTLSAMLRLDDHQTMVAFSGSAALDKVSEFRPDIIFLDIGLPEMDGYEVCRQFRTLDHCRDTCIIALTGYGTKEDRKKALQAGFSEHLVKPIQYNTLQALIEQACVNRKQTFKGEEHDLLD